MVCTNSFTFGSDFQYLHARQACAELLLYILNKITKRGLVGKSPARLNSVPIRPIRIPLRLFSKQKRQRSKLFSMTSPNRQKTNIS